MASLSLDGKGRIAVGCDADFVLLDEQGTVLQTIVSGGTVYERERSGRPRDQIVAGSNHMRT